MSIKIENLGYVVNVDREEKKVLNNISLMIEDNEFVAIIGRTGAGKSTLIEHICALRMPTSGSITIDQIQVSKKSIKNIREKIGIVFQIPEHQLFEDSVYKDIAFGLNNLGLSSEEIDVKVKDICRLLEIDFDLLDRSPFELSDGDKRKVAIAGVLAMDPKILIFDEPSAGLDNLSKRRIFDILAKLKNDEQKTIIVVSHNIEEIVNLTDRIVVMNNGEIAFDGNADELVNLNENTLDYYIELPDIPLLMHKLNRVFPQINENVFSIDEAKKELLRILTNSASQRE